MSGVALPSYSPRFKPAPPTDSPFWHDIQVQLDFSIIGAPKCGTTWLHTCLRQHPVIYLPDEQNFFTLFSQRGPAYYNKLYQVAGDRRCGDYSNTYMLDVNLPHIWAARYPQLKLIMVCRNPIQRAFSHYVMDVDKSGIDPNRLSFYDALFQPVTYSYFELGLYHKHLTNFLESFSREAILVLIFEDLIKHPASTLARVFDFLEVGPLESIEIPEKENTRLDRALFKHTALRSGRSLAYKFLPNKLYAALRKTYYTKLRSVVERRALPDKLVMFDEAHDLLHQAYYEPNRRLEEFLGFDLSMWDQ